jgi:NAD-dependent deacetylase
MNTPSNSQLAEWIHSAKSIVALTGAGISTGSGIPDFRSASGIYSDKKNVNVFDLDAFRRDPSIFYTFAREFYPKVHQAQPNAAHRALAAIPNLTVITQNVDDYHQRAGSDPVYTIHGDYIWSTCQSCGARIETTELFPIIERGDIPHCVCEGVYKPDITFFGELVPARQWDAALRAIRQADLVLVLGTSLCAYPAALLPDYRPSSSKLVVINQDPTPIDNQADLIIHDDLCRVLGELPRSG